MFPVIESLHDTTVLFLFLRNTHTVFSTLTITVYNPSTVHFSPQPCHYLFKKKKDLFYDLTYGHEEQKNLRIPHKLVYISGLFASYTEAAITVQNNHLHP